MLILWLNVPYSDAIQRRNDSRSYKDPVVILQRHTGVLDVVENCHYLGMALKAGVLQISWSCFICKVRCCDFNLFICSSFSIVKCSVCRVLRRIFGPKRDGVTGEWRKLRNEELNDLYSSPNIVWVIKSRRMRWAGHVARMGEGGGVHKVLVGKPEGKRHWGDQDVDGRIILKWILRKWEGVVGTGWSWLRIGTGGGRLWVR